MAKVKAPLFSLAAAGSVGEIAYRTTNGQSLARKKPKTPTGQPSQDQLIIRAKCAAAAAAWRQLDPATKAKWKAQGINTHRAGQGGTTLHLNHGFALFLQEWHTQWISEPNLPRLPA